MSMNLFRQALYFIGCLLSIPTINAFSQTVHLQPFVFGHDRDLPLALKAIGVSDFVFTDWDGDGDEDILTAGRGSFHLVLNLGNANHPRFLNTYTDRSLVYRNPHIGRFIAIIKKTGLDGSVNERPSVIGIECQNQIKDIGKVKLGLFMYTPSVTEGHVNWKVTQAIGVDGKPIQAFSDTWMCATIATADLNGDGKEDIVVDISHPWKALPSGKFHDGYKTPHDAWVTDASRIYIMYNRSMGNKLIFDNPVMVTADGSPIAPFGFPYPATCDINGDGLLDLIVGQHKPGLMYFQNIGTRTAPKFTYKGLLGDDRGAAINSILAIHPKFADLNGDGHSDLIASTYFGCVNSLLWFDHANVNTGINGWSKKGPLMMVGDSSTPVMPQGIGTVEPVDWDNDGDIDLVVGSEPCAPAVVINEGTDAKPIWDIPAPLKFVDGSPVEYYSIDYGLGSVWGPEEWYMERCTPRLTDWDGDGILDILTGSMGERQLFLKGQMIKGELRFERPVAFTVKGKPLLAAHRVQPDVVDINHDGHPDLIALDENNIVKVWPGDGTTLLKDPVTYLDFEGKPLQLSTRGLDIGHGRSALCSVDWNLDGRPDLIVYLGFSRKRGGLYYYQASDTPLQFNKPVRFSKPISFDNGGVGIADWDKDGYLDIFTGGDRSQMHLTANPRGNLFVILGKTLPVPPTRRRSNLKSPKVH